MQAAIELLWVVLVGLVFMMLGSSRLLGCIRLLALHGLALGLLPLAFAGDHLGARAVLIAAVSAVLKGWVMPGMLRRALRRAEVRQEIEPYVGFSTSMFIGIGLMAIGFWLGGRLSHGGVAAEVTVVAVALFHILAGLFLIVSRRKALTQVIGYLVLESGIYIFGVALAFEAPLLVEFGILLDVLAAVFVMGIMIFQISATFDHIDSDRLTQLKD